MLGIKIPALIKLPKKKETIIRTMMEGEENLIGILGMILWANQKKIKIIKIS